MAVALMLSGCDSISQFLPNLPQVNTRSSSQPTPRVPAQSPATAQMEAQVRQRINEIRQKRGLSQLRHNEKLAQVARNYSQQMAEKNFFSHTSPEGSTMVKRVRSAGIFYFMLGENLFMCTNLPQPVPSSIQGWMNSPGHRENLLRPEYRETGIGVWRKGNSYYFTQLFMRSLSLN
ncbi:MAG TPA: CAP domain-containing protein [Coleofasciculaceae cyanobacterium]